jgi:hypothetical protein
MEFLSTQREAGGGAIPIVGHCRGPKCSLGRALPWENILQPPVSCAGYNTEHVVYAEGDTGPQIGHTRKVCLYSAESAGVIWCREGGSNPHGGEPRRILSPRFRVPLAIRFLAFTKNLDSLQPRFEHSRDTPNTPSLAPIHPLFSGCCKASVRVLGCRYPAQTPGWAPTMPASRSI